MLETELIKNIYNQLLNNKDSALCKNCYIVSDIGDVQQKNTFIQNHLMPDRLREFNLKVVNQLED